MAARKPAPRLRPGGSTSRCPKSIRDSGRSGAHRSPRRKPPRARAATRWTSKSGGAGRSWEWSILDARTIAASGAIGVASRVPGFEHAASAIDWARSAFDCDGQAIDWVLSEFDCARKAIEWGRSAFDSAQKAIHWV